MVADPALVLAVKTRSRGVPVEKSSPQMMIAASRRGVVAAGVVVPGVVVVLVVVPPVVVPGVVVDCVTVVFGESDPVVFICAATGAAAVSAISTATSVVR